MAIIDAEKYKIHIGSSSLQSLEKYFGRSNYAKVFVLVDQNSKRYCLAPIKKILGAQNYILIQIKSGEKNKNIRSCELVWKSLSKEKADRSTLLVNLGGGVITDLGGFAASTYKRGIDFINIPTTLLAQVDASVGGKTGIDYLNFKNQVGCFAFPKAVFVIPSFTHTQSMREFLSGYAEVVKHGLIADVNYWSELMKASPIKLKGKNPSVNKKLESIIETSIRVKNKIAETDPLEKNIRKSLNFGHTIGHAIESASLKSKKSLLHGEAIAIGIICESYLSRKYCGLSDGALSVISKYIIKEFPCKKITEPTNKLINYMLQDKKNKNGDINFTLLKDIGNCAINQSCSEELIEESLGYYNTLCE